MFLTRPFYDHKCVSEVNAVHLLEASFQTLRFFVNVRYNFTTERILLYPLNVVDALDFFFFFSITDLPILQIRCVYVNKSLQVEKDI